MCVTIYICCKYCVTSIFLTTVKSYDELLRKIKNISLCLQNRVTKKSKQILNAKIAVRTLCARRERAVNTLQQLFAHCENVRDAVKTLWERRVDAVGTLWGRYVHAITGKFDILGVFCGIAVWCDWGLSNSGWGFTPQTEREMHLMIILNDRDFARHAIII